MKLRSLFITGLAVSLGLGMSGCSSSSNSSTAEKPSTGSDTPTKKQLVVWDWQDPYKAEIRKPMDQVIAQFKQENPNVELKIEPISNDDIRTKLLAAVSAGSLPDVAYLDGQSLAEFQATGILEPLTSYVDKWGQSKDFPSKVWDAVKFGNDVFGIPGDGDVRTLLYRTDIMKKAGLDPTKPPSNWTDLVTDAKKMMDAGKSSGIQYGFAMNAGNSEHTSMRALPYIWDLGGDFIDSNGKPSLNSEPVIKTLQFMTDLVQKDKVSPPDSYLRTKKEVASLVNSGQAAMAIVGSWEWRSDSNYLSQSKLKGNIASAPIPLPDGSKVNKPYTAVGYGTWVIFKNSKAKDEAWKWIEKVTSPEHEVNIFKEGTGNMPLRLSAYKDPVFSSDPIFKSFIDVMPNARPRPKTANYELLSQSWREAVQAAVSGKKSPKDALDEAQKKVESQWK